MTWAKLASAPLGRSHPRSARPRQNCFEGQLKTTREILGVPADYKIGHRSASDTGYAMEMAMLVTAWRAPAEIGRMGSFGAGWVTDAVKQLQDRGTTYIQLDYGSKFVDKFLGGSAFFKL